MALVYTRATLLPLFVVIFATRSYVCSEYLRLCSARLSGDRLRVSSPMIVFVAVRSEQRREKVFLPDPCACSVLYRYARCVRACAARLLNMHARLPYWQKGAQMLEHTHQSSLRRTPFGDTRLTGSTVWHGDRHAARARCDEVREGWISNTMGSAQYRLHDVTSTEINIRREGTVMRVC